MSNTDLQIGENILRDFIKPVYTLSRLGQQTKKCYSDGIWLFWLFMRCSMLVSDIMTKKVISVHSDTPVKEIATLLIKHDLKGVPVIDDQQKVIGIITECDLILQNATLHLPTFIQILDGVFPFGKKETEEELRRIVGAVAQDVMSRSPVCAPLDMTVEDMATLMWERKVNPVPITQDDKLIGIVSRADIVRLLTQSR